MINSEYKTLDINGEIDLSFLEGKIKGFADNPNTYRMYVKAMGFIDDLEQAKELILNVVDSKTIMGYAYLTKGSSNMEEKLYLIIRSNIK